MKRAFAIAPFAVFLPWLFSILLPALPAEEQAPKPEPTIQSLTAEVADLKRQIAQIQTSFSYEMRVCTAAIQAGREFIGTVSQPTKSQIKKKETPKP